MGKEIKEYEVYYSQCGREAIARKIASNARDAEIACLSEGKMNVVAVPVMPEMVTEDDYLPGCPQYVTECP